MKNNVTFVKDRKTIVDMMEKLYDLAKRKKIDLLRVIVMTDVLNWVVEKDDDYLEQIVEDCEKLNDIT